MRKTLVFISMLVLLVSQGCDRSGLRAEAKLWPTIEPYQTGHLEVSDIHAIYYELCGNPRGKPVFTLHGGPGGSSSPYMRRFFNPECFLIVQHDQRGCGQSKPYGEIRGNTTQDLVGDIERLREHLGVDEIILFGGSWGTTLALAYAETYPEHVGGMVLRAVFTATRGEIDHFYHGGVGKFFPEVYEKLVAELPESKGGDIPAQLLKLVQSEDPETSARASRAWAEYEIKIASLYLPDEQLERILSGYNSHAFALLENYYMVNACFLEEGQLLAGADRIAGIPVVIVNGRYDVICPPITAYRLHRRLPKSRLIIAESSGHWMGEKRIEAALIEAMRDFE